MPAIEPNVPALLGLCRGEYADRELIVYGDRRTSYADMEEQSARLACQLIGAGIGKGAHVGLLLPDDERFIISWMAVTRIGGVAVAIWTLATPRELLRLVRHADLRMIVAVTGFLNHDYLAAIS